MKKIISLAILTALFLPLLVGTASAAPYFGGGIEVVAEDVTMIKSGLCGRSISFTDGDFKSALAIPDFKRIRITEIPSSTEGTLLLGSRRVGEGRCIDRKSIGALSFIPASESVGESSFKFSVDGYCGGAEIECKLRFIEKVNYAPETRGDSKSALAFNTQESVSVWGELQASDPEGDALEYIIVTPPRYGNLSITDSSVGKFSYTPDGGYIGRDKFSYVVRDEYGNYSKPASVSLRIEERMCDTVYSDMTEREEYNAALAMTAMGIMNGRQVGDELCFDPDGKLTRAEFVAMLMKCAGMRPESGIAYSFFDDDGDINPSLRGYIATAQKIGLVGGDFVDGRLIFSPNGEITRYECARLLSTVLGLSEEGEERVFATDEDIPVWARAGVYAMSTCGIFSSLDRDSLSAPITRADGARYLYLLSQLI